MKINEMTRRVAKHLGWDKQQRVEWKLYGTSTTYPPEPLSVERERMLDMYVAFTGAGLLQKEGEMAHSEEKEILPKDLLEDAESGDRSSVWLQMSAEDLPQNPESQESLGAQLRQMDRLSTLHSLQFFSRSSFMPNALMQGMQNQQLSGQLGAFNQFDQLNKKGN